MADGSPTANARCEGDARIAAPTMSVGDVEIVLPDHYRLSREANSALVHVIMAVRDRMLGSGRVVG